MISKSASYAIRAVIKIASLENGNYIDVKQLANDIKAPSNYLSKLLQVLARYNIVVSQKGVGGGFSLAKSPDKISLFDIVDPFDNVKQSKNCLLGAKDCGKGHNCAIHNRWDYVQKQFIDMLKETKISSLLEKNKN